ASPAGLAASVGAEFLWVGGWGELQLGLQCDLRCPRHGDQHFSTHPTINRIHSRFHQCLGQANLS
ncbi:unnamed protein product, partial [Closterium sp. NIES-64]